MKMKLLILLVLIAVVTARPGNYYEGNYENLVKEMLSNNRLMKAYVLCLLDKGNCTPEGKHFKELIPEALETNCGKCTETQKSLAAKSIDAIKTTLPKEYKALIKKFAPEGRGTEQLDDFIANYKS